MTSDIWSERLVALRILFWRLDSACDSWELLSLAWKARSLSMEEKQVRG